MEILYLYFSHHITYHFYSH